MQDSRWVRKGETDEGGEKEEEEKKNEEKGKEDTNHLLVSYDEISHSGWFSFLFLCKAVCFFNIFMY